MNKKTNDFRNEIPFEKITNIIKSGSNSIRILSSTSEISVLCNNRDKVLEVISEQLKISHTKRVIIEKYLTKSTCDQKENEIEKIREQVQNIE